MDVGGSAFFPGVGDEKEPGRAPQTAVLGQYLRASRDARQLFVYNAA